MTSRGKIWLSTIVILLVAIAAGLFDAPVPSSFPGAHFWNSLPFRLGLDLQGGAHLVYEADTSNIAGGDRDSAVEGTRDVIERRVNALGVSEPLVQTNKSVDGDYRVIIELAGVFDVNEAIAQIGETPLLEFKELKDEELNVIGGSGEAEGIDVSEVRTRAEDVLHRALAGEDFETLAVEFSEDPSAAQNNGNLGFAQEGLYVPEFDTVAFNGDFASETVWPELVETPFGLHIIKKLSERLSTRQQSPEAPADGGQASSGQEGEREVSVSHILFLTQEIPQPGAQDGISPDDWINTELTGKNLKRASLDFDQTLGDPLVSLEFDGEGAKLFQDITRRNIGQPVAIFLDGVAISVPVVQQEISGGSAVITGQFNVKEAKELANRLNAGALPVPIELISQQTVGPSLGKLSVENSLRAGLIGLLLVAIFMIGYYRLPGLISVIALAVYISLVLLFLQLLNVTLTLAGIAGFILTIGMAVDANVLIFERMKEELRQGKKLEKAIDLGFKRAWTSIRDANISSLITAVILYWFGTSFIRGFAITFAIGILLSMFSAVVVTKTFLKLIERFEARHLLFGVRPFKPTDTPAN